MNQYPAILIVSHSHDLAIGMSKILRSLNPDVLIEYCAGNNRGGLGTDPQAITSVLQKLATNTRDSYVLADMGSARFCVQEILETKVQGGIGKITLVTGPFFESAIDLVTKLKENSDSDQGGIEKRINLSSENTGPFEPASPKDDPETIAHSVYLPFTDGLHARPAAGLVQFFSQFDAEISLQRVDAKSILELLKLQIVGPQQVELQISGPDADQVVRKLEEYLKQI